MEGRPLCKCHGEPMFKNGKHAGRGRTTVEWRCSVKKRELNHSHHWHGGGREQRQRRYAERKAAGLCVRCASPGLSETLCWDCLNEQEARDAVGV